MGFIRNEMTTDDMFLHVYSDLSKEELEKKVDQQLTSQRYKMTGGPKMGN